jgi:hypothetical protein
VLGPGGVLLIAVHGGAGPPAPTTGSAGTCRSGPACGRWTSQRQLSRKKPGSPSCASAPGSHIPASSPPEGCTSGRRLAAAATHRADITVGRNTPG